MSSSSDKLIAFTGVIIAIVALVSSVYVPTSIEKRQRDVSNQQACIAEVAELHSQVEQLKSKSEDAVKSESGGFTAERASAQSARDKVFTLCANVHLQNGDSVIAVTDQPWVSSPSVITDVWDNSNMGDVERWAVATINDLAKIQPHFFNNPFS